VPAERVGDVEAVEFPRVRKRRKKTRAEGGIRNKRGFSFGVSRDGVLLSTVSNLAGDAKKEKKKRSGATREILGGSALNNENKRNRAGLKSLAFTSGGGSENAEKKRMGALSTAENAKEGPQSRRGNDLLARWGDADRAIPGESDQIWLKAIGKEKYNRWFRDI